MSFMVETTDTAVNSKLFTALNHFVQVDLNALLDIDIDIYICMYGEIATE